MSPRRRFAAALNALLEQIVDVRQQALGAPTRDLVAEPNLPALIGRLHDFAQERAEQLSILTIDRARTREVHVVQKRAPPAQRDRALEVCAAFFPVAAVLLW